MSDFTIDTRDLQFAFQQYAAATKKDASEMLNRAGRNIAFRAASMTPQVSKEEIRAELAGNPKMLAALTAMKLKAKGRTTTDFKAEMEKFIRSRTASRNYLKSGWGKVVLAFGGKFRGAAFKGSTGEASLATAADLIAQLFVEISEPTASKAEGAEKIGGKAMQDAIDYVARDMIDYAQKKMARTAATHSY